MKIRKLIGLAGVARDENFIAQTWGKRFELSMIAIALWLPLQWYLQRTSAISPTYNNLCNWLIWLFFVAETSTLLVLVANRSRYLARNWMNLIIILIGIPIISKHIQIVFIIRIIQSLLLLRVLLPWWDTGVNILSQNKLGTTLLISCAITLLWGIVMSVVDPGIHTPWDGIWWAWETVTTVGYGDIVPTSIFGKILGIVLMLMGVGLISLLTANFSAYFIGKGTQAIKEEEDQLLVLLKDIQRQLNHIERRIEQLEAKR